MLSIYKNDQLPEGNLDSSVTLSPPYVLSPAFILVRNTIIRPLLIPQPSAFPLIRTPWCPVVSMLFGDIFGIPLHLILPTPSAVALPLAPTAPRSRRLNVLVGAWLKLFLRALFAIISVFFFSQFFRINISHIQFFSPLSMIILQLYLTDSAVRQDFPAGTTLSHLLVEFRM